MIVYIIRWGGNISSVLGSDASFREVSIAYCVSKAGLNQLTRLNAHELAIYKVRVNGIKLGTIATNVLMTVGMFQENCTKSSN